MKSIIPFLTMPVLLILAACDRSAPRGDEDRPFVTCLTVQSISNRVRQGAGYLALIKGDQETDLSFKLGGILDLIGPQAGAEWDQGAPVQKGDLLARLVQTDFQSQLLAAESKVKLDRAELERQRGLYETKAVALAELQRQETTLQASEAQLAQARQAWADSMLRAPFSGTVLNRMARVGETIAPGQVVLRIADFTAVSIEAGVPAGLAAGVRTGDSYRVTIAALNDLSLDAKVTEVGVAARLEDSLFRVVLKAPNPDRRIKSGMTANVLFNSPTARPGALPAILIPMSALVAEGADQQALAVFVIDREQRARRTAVKTGEIVGNNIEILAGLQAGDRIAVAGAGNLSDGLAVRTRAGSGE